MRFEGDPEEGQPTPIPSQEGYLFSLFPFHCWLPRSCAGVSISAFLATHRMLPRRSPPAPSRPSAAALGREGAGGVRCHWLIVALDRATPRHKTGAASNHVKHVPGGDLILSVLSHEIPLPRRGKGWVLSKPSWASIRFKLTAASDLVLSYYSYEIITFF